MLQHRAFVRYPCEIVFDSAELQAGEFAYPMPRGTVPEDGFTMFVHPVFMIDLARVPVLVLYHLVAVNYGEFASADEAETFGAAALGLTRDEYYAALCAMADEIGGGDPGDTAAPVAACGLPMWESQDCSCGDAAGGCGH